MLRKFILGTMTDEMSRVGIESSGTPLEKEYKIITDAMSRCGTGNHVFDAKAYNPDAVQRVREMWTSRMEFEHRSSTVFSHLAVQLLEAGATLDSKVVMLRMAQDELRHTETCGRVLEGLGAKPECLSDLHSAVAPLAKHAGLSPQERAMRNVVFTTCLSEMVAVARFVDTLETMSDPFLRDATRLLLSDEILHGQFGFHYLTAWRPWLEQHPEAVASLERYLRHAFAVLEELLAGPPVAPQPITADELALGLQEPSRARDVFYATIEQAVVPGLEQLGLAAGTLWRSRRREV